MSSNDERPCGNVDVACLANRRIWDFVHERPNLSLRAGTGYYSTPFRGGLFGKVKAVDVAKKLSNRGVDVLWLGTNPCVPSSLDKIINTPADDGDFPSFERQIESGFFGSSRWEVNGEPKADFNPLEKPKAGWKVYRDLFQRLGLKLHSVAMANFIPWGSRDTRALVEQLGRANGPLLRRAVEFADDLNVEIVQALAPKLVVVPFSLGLSDALNGVGPIGISLKKATDAHSFAIQLPKRTFNFHTAICKRSKLAVHTLFVPHPASLRLSNEAKSRVVSEVAKTLRDLE
jgi:hypothetical protein